MVNIKKINIKNRIYYFFNDMIRIKDLNLDLIKIDKRWYKNRDICYIGHTFYKQSIFDPRSEKLFKFF